MDFESIRGREGRKEGRKEGKRERKKNGIFSKNGNGISWERRWRKVATGMEEEKYGRGGVGDKLEVYGCPLNLGFNDPRTSILPLDRHRSLSRWN